MTPTFAAPSLRARALSLLVVLGAGPSATAQAITTVKLATLAPEGSPWHLMLQDLAAQWKSVSGGRVVLRVYAGGVAGDEPDVVRKMRTGALQAGVLTAVGLAEIDAAVHAMSLPMIFADAAEATAVFDKMKPRLEAGLDKKGFMILAWADAGWIHFFAQKPVETPEDLRDHKLFTWAGDAQGTEAWRSAGFHPVPLASAEILAALQTGEVTALGCPPRVALIAQYYNHARHMTDLPWQFLIGAIAIAKESWDRVPADARPALKKAAEEAGRRLRDENLKSGGSDLEAMKRRGLHVVPVAAKARAQWESLAVSLYPKLRGSLVPGDVVEEALKYRAAYRKAASRTAGSH